jgi:hypothetical protein
LNDEQTYFYEEPWLAGAAVTLLNLAVAESEKQIAYVVEKENLPLNARFGVLNAKV